MSGVLVIAESRRGELREVSLELVSAALELKDQAGGPVAVAVVGADAFGAAGVDEVITVAAPTEHFEAHVHAAALEALIERQQPSVVLLGHTIDSLGFGPAVAAKLGLGFASDVTALAWDGGPIATRGGYGGKVEVELEFPGKDTVLLMLRAGAFEPAEATGAPPPPSAASKAPARSMSSTVSLPGNSSSTSTLPP